MSATEYRHELLRLHLQFAVSLAIGDLTARGGPHDNDWDTARAFGPVLAEKGDQILYRTNETAALVSRLVRAIAVMAHVPGGVHVCGLHWCARHHPHGRRDSRAVCERCVAEQRGGAQ